MLKPFLILFALLSFNSVFGQVVADTTSVKDTCKFDIPQFLSPNSHSSYHIICNCKIIEFEFKLYDRWGTLKLTFNDITTEIKPGQFPAGTYCYLILGTYESKKHFEKVGYFQINK